MAYRPSHADATYDAKYGIRAVAGGGRSSARETIGRVAGAAVARKVGFVGGKQYNDTREAEVSPPLLGYVFLTKAGSGSKFKNLRFWEWKEFVVFVVVYLTLTTDPLRIQPWSQDRRNYTPNQTGNNFGEQKEKNKSRGKMNKKYKQKKQIKGNHIQ